MADFSAIPWIAEHIESYRSDPEKAHLWDSTPLGGPGLLPTPRSIRPTTSTRSALKRARFRW